MVNALHRRKKNSEPEQFALREVRDLVYDDLFSVLSMGATLDARSSVIRDLFKRKESFVRRRESPLYTRRV